MMDEASVGMLGRSISIEEAFKKDIGEFGPGQWKMAAMVGGGGCAENVGKFWL